MKKCVVFSLLMLCLTACAVDRDYRAADAATHAAVAPEYLRYVEEDPSLDDEGRQLRRDTIASWRARLDGWKD